VASHPKGNDVLVLGWAAHSEVA